MESTVIQLGISGLVVKVPPCHMELSLNMAPRSSFLSVQTLESTQVLVSFQPTWAPGFNSWLLAPTSTIAGN